jgi:hypothetical protein
LQIFVRAMEQRNGLEAVRIQAERKAIMANQ